MRDKLIELMEHSVCESGACPSCEHFNDIKNCIEYQQKARADYLIANGVTFAPDNNVPCKFCQEDKDGYRAMFGAFSIHNPFHGSTWEIATGHCKPRQIYFCPMCGRKLSEPPKEGE